MNPEQEQKLNEVYEFMQSLKNDATIPFEVDGAFKSRFNLEFAATGGLSVSTKDKDSEDQSIDESGSAIYPVLGDPDGFLEIEISGTTYFIPYYT